MPRLHTHYVLLNGKRLGKQAFDIEAGFTGLGPCGEGREDEDFPQL